MRYLQIFEFNFAENYHHLYSLLSQMKISVLDMERKEAKQKYSDALAAYVTLYFGRPLEKLNVSVYVIFECFITFIQTFFDGVQARVASGVKASEIGYQLAFSKQELRKVISQYPGSTVMYCLCCLVFSDLYLMM